MPVYVHHSKKGPDFTWDQAKIAVLLAQVRYRQGRFLGRIEGMGVEFQTEARGTVRQLELEAFGSTGKAFLDILSDALKHYLSPLTRERMLRWQSALSPGRSAVTAKGKIHFQVSIADSSDIGFANLVHWWNSLTSIDPVIKAGVGYAWVMLKGASDAGNDRLAELVMEILMARANQGGERFYSVVTQLRQEERERLLLLKDIDKASLDVTEWLEWFLGCVNSAIDKAGEALGLILRKDRFWERCSGMSLNERQRKAITKLLDNDEEISSSQWAVLTNTSQDTAGRDINELVRLGILKKGSGGGRSTSYTLADR